MEKYSDDDKFSAIDAALSVKTEIAKESGCVTRSPKQSL